MRPKTTVMLVLVLAACAALAAVPVAAATPGYCRGDFPLDADQMPERIALTGCDIVGRTVAAGGLRVEVPPPGEQRSIHAVRTNGEAGLTVSTTPDGFVEITAANTLSAAAAPANDSLADAQVVSTPTSNSWTRNGTTVDATVQGKDADVNLSCAIPRSRRPDATVWYRYVAQHDGEVKVSLANIAPAGAVVRTQVFATKALYPELCNAGTMYVTKGTPYYVRVGSVGTPATFRVRWTPPVPPHDRFAKALTKTLPSSTATRSMFGTTLEAGEPNPTCKSNTAGTAWHRADVGKLRRLEVNTAGSPVAVYQGTTLTGLKQVACFNSAWGKLVILPSSAPVYLQQWHTKAEEAWLDVYSGEPLPDASPPCSDSAYYVQSDSAPRTPLRWRYNGANAPSAFASTALAAIKQGVGVITSSTNDCGLADQVTATAEYLGNTGRQATLCTTSKPDGVNTVDFGPAIDYGVLGIACSSGRYLSDGRVQITETDMRLTKNEAWTLSPDAPSCGWEYDMVGVVVHEVGHAFALLHPYDVGNLTMAAFSSGCTGAYRTLGRGDVLGLRSLY